MDQEAFRQLVSSSSAVSGPSHASSSQRSFGKAAKRSTSQHPSSTKPSDLKPRHLKPKISGDAYIDRAAARRSGIPNTEFGDIEALYRDFEQRIAAAETEQERQLLRDQISSVGGDAKHSVLVKGLDWALLAQNKAKLERETNDATGEEGDLESAYQASLTQDSRDERPKGKRSREEIMEAIKRRREGKASEAVATIGVEDEKGRMASAFRPIGFKPIGSADQQREANKAEYKWVNGKRMRRKNKTISSVGRVGPKGVEEPNPQQDRLDSALVGATEARSTTIKEEMSRPRAPQPAADSSLHVAAKKSTANQTSAEHHSPAEGPLHSLASSTHATKASPSHTPAAATEIPAAGAAIEEPKAEADDEDEDIFADVGGWDGIHDIKDDDEHKSDDDQTQYRSNSTDNCAASQPDHLTNSLITPAPVDTDSETDLHSVPLPPEQPSTQNQPNVDPLSNAVPAHTEPSLPVITQSESALQPTTLPSLPPTDEQAQQDKPNHRKSKWDLLDHDRESKSKNKSKKKNHKKNK